MHRCGRATAATEGACIDQQQDRLCLASAEQQQDRASASRRLEQGRLCKDTTAGTEAASLRRQQGRLCHPAPCGEATAATYHASRRREQRRLCMDTTEQPLSACIATATAGRTKHRYGEATVATHQESSLGYASLQRSAAEQRQRQSICIATARPGHQGNGSDRGCIASARAGSRED